MAESSNIFIFKDLNDGNFQVLYDTDVIITLTSDEKNQLDKILKGNTSIMNTNFELSKYVKDINDNKSLNNDDINALNNMYHQLLKTEINIILKKIIEFEDYKELAIKPILDSLQIKFTKINNLLEHYKAQDRTDIQKGGSKNCYEKTKNYCKYIKYKLKYIHQKNLML